MGLMLGAIVFTSGAAARGIGDTIASTSAMTASERAAADGFNKRQRKAFEQYGSLGVITVGMDDPRIVVQCETIAQSHAATAAEETDRDRRIAKFADVWRFQQRIAQPLQAAKGTLGEEGYERAIQESEQNMNLLSMIGDPLLTSESVLPDDLMHQFTGMLAYRCGQMLGAMGIAPVSGDPPPEYLEENAGFRFRGADYGQIFAETQLGPYAKAMCRGGAAADFGAAPLDQRGLEGMSLLDWAIECDDRASFDALIGAGFDLFAQGLFGDPPLVRTASEKRLWYLTRLLDEGVNPDTMGKSKSALLASMDDLDAINFGGDAQAAFNLLRSRGASLNFPNFGESIWQRWSLHDTRWDLILAHWGEFESDPVELASDLEFYLSGEMAWARKEYKGAALEVKELLIAQHAVCFPVGRPYDMPTDERGFRIQPDCPKGK